MTHQTMALHLSTRTKVRLTGVEYRIETDCKEEPPPEDRRQANSQKKIGLNLIVRKLTSQVKRVLDSFLLVDRWSRPYTLSFSSSSLVVSPLAFSA